MSEHITHIAVYEDLMRIILNHDEICDAFKFCIQNQYDSGLLGSGSRGNHIYALPILDTFKDQWESVQNDESAQIKVAYAIGWLTHRAADRRLKLVFAEAENDPNPAFSNNMCRIYHDAMSFKMVYEGGQKPCLSEFHELSPATFDYDMQCHAASAMLDISKAEPLFNRMWQADMISKHIFMNDQNDFNAWLDKFVDVFPELTEDFREYEKAYNDPDPVQTNRYYDEDNYYDASDELIQYVRAYQNGVNSEIDFTAAVEKAKNQSLYSQSLRQGWFYLKAASDYFTNAITKNKFQQVIDKRIS